MALRSHLLFCFIPHNLFNKHQGCPGARTTREATLPFLHCLPCSSIPSESLHSVPLFLSLKTTPRPCTGRTSPGPHLRSVTGLCHCTGCHCRGSWGRLGSVGTNTFTADPKGTATSTMDTPAVCHGHCCTLHGHHRGSATSVGTHWHKPCTSHQGETLLTLPLAASWL